MKKYLLIGVSIAIIALIISFVIPKQSPENVCLDAFAKQFGEEFSNPQIKAKTWNAISFDIEGYYSGGQWTCALSNNPVEFRSGQLLPTNSKMIWFSSDDLVGK